MENATMKKAKQFRSSFWYTVPTTSMKDPNLRGPIEQFVDLKFLDPVTYECHIDTTASIILPLFPLLVYVCFAVLFEEK